MSESLFDRVVQLSELSSLFARATLERALKRANVDPQRMTRADLERALPEIRRSISPFITARLDVVMTNLENLVRRPAA
jgi:hypothetical protein